jgi:hypothetical protein
VPAARTQPGARLEAKGLVERERPPDDRRQVLCRLTVAGRSLIDAVDHTVDAADEAAFASLDTVSRRQLIGGGSGHGFKFAPAWDEQVAESVLGRRAPEPFFALARRRDRHE